MFDDITFEGVWVNGAAVDQDNAIVMNNLSGVVASDNNTFSRCNFLGFGTAVRSNWDSDDNTFDQCKFETLGHAFIYGKDMILGNEASGKSRGPSYNTVSRSTFNNIHRETIRVVNGENNISKRNKYVLCGNNGSIDTIPMFSIIKYEKDKNKSFEDYFSRTYALSSGSGLDNVPYYPEVEGSAFYKTEFENVISIGQVSNVRAFRLPGVANQAYEIDYTLVSENYRHIRSGTMHVVVDAYGDNVEISDEYHYTGDEAYLESIEFNVLLRDVDLDLTQETIDVIVTSTMPTDDATQMKYTVTAKKTNVI